MPKAQTSDMLGPGFYQPNNDWAELKKRTKSKKPPAFMDGIKPGFQTVALGSNYQKANYNPGPGKYKPENVGSPFSKEIVKDDANNS